MAPVDFGKTAGDYSQHRAGFPAELFERLRRFNIGLPGQRILDVGTGTGTLARGFAERGSLVTGLDPAPSMLQAGRRLAEEAGLRLNWLQGRAEDTPFRPDTFDCMSAGQCWHWFDRPRATQEARRLLRPSGHLLIAHLDWIPLPGNMVAATENLMLAYSPDWQGSSGSGLHPRWLADVATAGFQDIETFSFDVAIPYTHADWRGRVRASSPIGASLPPEKVAAFDAELRKLLAAHFPADPLFIPHRVFALICTAPI
jgi:SAM-dependent methyltransferase